MDLFGNINNMALIPKITSYDTKIIPSMYEDWWRITAIYEDKIFWEKEEKKQVKSRALTTESNKSIQYLKMQRERIDNNQEIHCPDFIDNKEKWYEFVHHWTQRNSDGWKLHCEKEKTFEIRWRWATWRKDNKNTYQKAEKPSVMDITL